MPKNKSKKFGNEMFFFRFEYFRCLKNYEKYQNKYKDLIRTYRYFPITFINVKYFFKLPSYFMSQGYRADSFKNYA